MKPTFDAWDKLSRMHSLVTLSLVVVGVIAVVAALFAFEWRGDAGFNAVGLSRIGEIRDSLVLRDAQNAVAPES
jgi:hypothetical protein